MKDKLKKYIRENYEKKKNIFSVLLENKLFNKSQTDYEEEVEDLSCFKEKSPMLKKRSTVDNFINDNKNENNFQKLLFKYIDDKFLKDSDVYNKVHIDRRLFSKIRSDSNYHPSKETILLLGFALELSEIEIEKLLESASYSLPKNNYYDLIIRFCFVEGIYEIKTINDLLDEYNCKLFNY